MGSATKACAGKAVLALDFVVVVAGGYFSFGLNVFLRFCVLVHVKPQHCNLELFILTWKVLLFFKAFSSVLFSG
jgi:hypothetical protein